MLIRIFSIMFPVFAIIGVGYLYGRFKKPDMNLPNLLNMDVFLPALVFSVLASKTFDLAQYRDLAIGGLLVILGSGLLAIPIQRLLKVDFRTFVPPIMFNNSGNMGLPLALLAFGEAAVPAAVVLFLIEMTLHFTLGAYIMDHRTRLLSLFRMPIIIATILGIAVSSADIVLPMPLEMLPFLDLPPQQQSLLIIFGALPPAVLNFIVAEQYSQEPEKVASMVMIGNLGSLVILPIALAIALSP